MSANVFELIHDSLREDYAIHPSSGFLPPQEPLDRLPEEWELWEQALDAAIDARLQLGVNADAEAASKSETWRSSVRVMPILPVNRLMPSEILLRRAHLVLSYTMHFYIHSLPQDASINIPPSIGVPLLRVSTYLQIPPDVTYSDTVVYNWTLKDPRAPLSIQNLRSRTMFTNSQDEEEFYLCSTRIELHGAEALEIIRTTMERITKGHPDAVSNATHSLQRMSTLIHELKDILMSVRDGCRPNPYYNDVRPWFSGEDSDAQKRKWSFDGLDAYPDLTQPTELSGPSAGQSSLVHALDAFLSVHSTKLSPSGKPSFQQRMRHYMPRQHRAFLNYLDNPPKSLRQFVHEKDDAGLLKSFNSAVQALKEFRDAHMVIATLYIVSPAANARRKLEKSKNSAGLAPRPSEPLKGTGGTDLVRFLKSVRDNTAAALI